MRKLTWKSIFRELKDLFIVWEFIVIVVFLFASHFGFFYFTMKNLYFALSISVVGTLFFLKVFVFPNRQLKKYQYHLSELLKYTTNVTFFLQTGNNVLHALEQAKTTVNKEIGRDIQKTIDHLEEHAELNTESFRKYEFASLNQFHRNLSIKYERGGNTSDLFDQIQRNMVFELKNRDDLYRKRKGFALNVYILLVMVLAVLLILKTNVPFLMDIFLSMSFVSMFTVSLTYCFILINLYFLQKHNLDISVKL